MPFSGQDDSSLPSNVKSMSPIRRRQWVSVFNSAFASCRKAGGSNCDGIAMRKANGVAKKASYVRLLAREGKGRSFIELATAEAPPTINIFPVPGTYKHPVWGNMEVTEEGNKEFVDNFNAHVYQKHIPLDAEHETKVSGAVAYFEELMMNDDGSVDARMDWTPRGVKLLEDDAFKFISPEWYEQWTDPASQEDFDNVLIGGALTTRPFFKGLRSLVASEDGLRDMAEDDEGEGQTVELVEEDLSEALVAAAQEEFSGILGSDISVVNLEDDHMIVSAGTGYYRLEYEQTSDGVSFTERPAEASWVAKDHPADHKEDEDKDKKKRNKNKKKGKEKQVADLDEMVKAAEKIEDDEEKKSWISKIASALGLNVSVTTDDGDDDDEDGDGDGDSKKTATEQITGLEAQLKQSEESRKASDARLGVLENTARSQRLRDIVLGRDEASIKKAAEAETKLHPMIGDLEAKMSVLEKLGEGTDEFEAYVASEREHAGQLHQTGLFKEIGDNSTDGNVDDSARKTFENRIAALRKDDSELTVAQATERIAKEDPKLYAKYDQEVTQRKVPLRTD